jgi:hypothetical protein
MRLVVRPMIQGGPSTPSTFLASKSYVLPIEEAIVSAFRQNALTLLIVR